MSDGTSPPLTDITVEETSFHMGGGDETVPAPRWLLTVDVVEDVGRCNRLHKLTSRPDAGTLVHVSLLCPDRLIHMNKDHIQSWEASYLGHLFGIRSYSLKTVLNLEGKSVEFKHIHQICLNSEFQSAFPLSPAGFESLTFCGFEY